MEIVLQYVWTIIVPVLSTVLINLVNKAINYQIQKIQDEKLKNLLLDGNAVILDSVNYVQQTYVGDLKAAGNFDAAAQKHAINQAKQRALDLMSSDMYMAMDKRYDDISKYIETVIESTIAKKKEEP